MPWYYKFLDVKFLPVIIGLFIVLGFTIIKIIKTPEYKLESIFSKFVYKLFSRYWPSTIFWNFLYWGIFVGICLVSPVFGLAISCVVSILVLGSALDGPFNDSADPFELWIPSAVIFWVIGVIVVVGLLIYGLYELTIGGFNRLLDSKDKDGKNV